MSDLVPLAKKTGGSSVGEHEWAKDGAVCDVPADLAAELLAIDPEEYSVAEKTAKAPRGTTKTAD